MTMHYVKLLSGGWLFSRRLVRSLYPTILMNWLEILPLSQSYFTEVTSRSSRILFCILICRPVSCCCFIGLRTHYLPIFGLLSIPKKREEPKCLKKKGMQGAQRYDFGRRRSRWYCYLNFYCYFSSCYLFWPYCVINQLKRNIFFRLTWYVIFSTQKANSLARSGTPNYFLNVGGLKIYM